MSPNEAPKRERRVDLDSLVVRKEADTSRFSKRLRQLKWDLESNLRWLSELPMRGVKYVASFRKKEWNLVDYPLRFVRQDKMHKAGEWRKEWPLWRVDVLGWIAFHGAGDTREEAYSDLAQKFAERKARGEPLPRPGTWVPLDIKFASTEQIDQHADLVPEFMRTILSLDVGDYFVSDESSLFDFDMSKSKEEWHTRIREVYGVDISDIENLNLVRIMERLREGGKQSRPM